MSNDTAAKKRKTSSLIAMARIAAHGRTGMPAGHLYAEMMVSSSFEEFQEVVQLLKFTKWVTESGHVLTATKVGMDIAKQVQSIIDMLPKSV